MAFKIHYVYDYSTKLCSKPEEVIQNHINPIVSAIGQGEAMLRKHRNLKLGDVQAYGRSDE
jgi:hypothetical protein